MEAFFQRHVLPARFCLNLATVAIIQSKYICQAGDLANAILSIPSLPSSAQFLSADQKALPNYNVYL